MRTGTSLVEVRLANVAVVGTSTEQRRDLCLRRDDLFSKRVDKEAFLGQPRQNRSVLHQSRIKSRDDAPFRPVGS